MPKLTPEQLAQIQQAHDNGEPHPAHTIKTDEKFSYCPGSGHLGADAMNLRVWLNNQMYGR